MNFESNTTKYGLRFALFLSISVGMIVVDSRSVALDSFRGALFAITKPLVEVAEIPADIRIALRVVFTDRKLVMEHNRAISEENAQLRRRIIQLESLEQHAKWLADLLNASEQLADPVLLASLKAIGLNPADQRVVINRGSSDGAFVGQAVLDFRGILGQIVEVSNTESAVTLITHSNHSIPVRVRRTGLLAVANGLGDSSEMSMPYVAGSPDIQAGDVLVSSGLGGRFPPDYPVAEVISVNIDGNEPFAKILARPFATIDYGYDVLIVMKPESAEQGSNSTVSMNETDSR